MNATVNRHGIYRLPRVVTNEQKAERERERQRAAEIEALNEKWDARIHGKTQRPPLTKQQRRLK